MEANTHNPNLRAIAFALVALTAAVPSLAHANGGPPSEEVHYGDLDLTSAAGVAVLDRRLDNAVKRVCGTASIRNLSGERIVERCREATWQSIRDDREVAIARANGGPDLANAQSAHSSSHGRVRLAAE